MILKTGISRSNSNVTPSLGSIQGLYQESQNQLGNQIMEARNLLPKIQLDYDFRVKISQICSELDVDGLRGDLVTNRASKAIAAFEGRTEEIGRAHV